MREILEQKYEKLFETYGFEKPIEAGSINTIIKTSIQCFLKYSSKPAIYCNGGHTGMLMADFMYELKPVRYIIDNYAVGNNIDGGFTVIRDAELEQSEIDAVIISSFKFRQDIRESLEKKHPGIRYLDLYENLKKNGVDLHADYYYYNHPYHQYHMINTLQREISVLEKQSEMISAYWQLISHYIQIKDFRTALIKSKELATISNIEHHKELSNDLEELYETEQKAAAEIAESNVLMLCFDGMRRQDISKELMPKMAKDFKKNTFSFENAYSFSTSTYESLIPVYSENQDLKTEYYNCNVIDETKCRFISEAKAENRQIFFYTDLAAYIESGKIQYSKAFQTVTEKFWDFIMDACESHNGLFYIHVLYESHFTFSNPYTTEKLISEGTAMLFEFLPQKGGRLRTDFERQHLDALRYVDDVVTPLISKMNCRIVVYADHGNLILNKDSKLEDIPELKYTCAEEWIRIPLMIKSPEQGVGVDTQIISLMSLNEIVISLMQKRTFKRRTVNYIKAARSELYNPDFRYLYTKAGKGQCLLAFEAFIFQEGYKLIIYSDGTVELVLTESDEKYEDEELTRLLFEQVKDNLTVCVADIVEKNDRMGTLL